MTGDHKRLEPRRDTNMAETNFPRKFWNLWRHVKTLYRLTETCSLGLLFTSLILDIHVMINWHLSKQGICWPVSCDHIAGSSVQLIEVTCFFLSWPLTKYWLSIGSRAHVMLTCWKPGRIVRKPANGSPGLKFIWIITFSSIQMFFAALFWVYGDYKPQNRKSSSKQKTSPQSYKTQINILPFPGLAQTGTEQLGQGATLLGWPKSIYYHFTGIIFSHGFITLVSTHNM